MIFLLLSISKSISISVNSENFEELINQSLNKSLILEFWDPWCNHCAAFRPIWEQLNNQSNPQLIFADTNCRENARFCKNISNAGYPQVLFYDTTRKKFISYNGVMNYLSIQQFIHKQLNFPIIFLDSFDECSSYRNMTNTSSLFILRASKDNDELIKTYRNLVISHRFSSANFVFIPSNSTELIAYKSFSFYIQYDGNWDTESLEQFFQHNSLPILPPITQNIFDTYKEKNQLCFTIFLNNISQYNEALDIVLKLNSSHQYFYSLFSSDDYFCRFIGVQQKYLPSLYILDIANEQWTFMQKDFSYHNLKDYDKYFNASKAKWKGPGNGLFSGIYSTFLSLWATGGISLYIVILCIIVLVSIIGFLVYDLYSSFRSDPLQIDKFE